MSDYYPPGITSTPYDEERPMTARPDALAVKALARDVHYAITDDGLAPLSPADNNAMRDAILRVLTPDRIAALEASPGCDDGMLPDALVPHTKEWYRLCERRFHVDKITISGALAEAIVSALAAAPKASAPVEGTQACRDGIGFDCGLPFAHDGHCIATPQADPAPPVAGEVLVVAWAATGEDGKVEALGFNQSRSRFTAPLVFQADHARMVAAKDAEIAKLQALRKHHRARHKSYKRRHADAEQRAEAMAGLLLLCKEKLALYREAHDGRYIGGVEYTRLITRIDALLRDGLAGQEGAE